MKKSVGAIMILSFATSVIVSTVVFIQASPLPDKGTFMSWYSPESVRVASLSGQKM